MARIVLVQHGEKEGVPGDPGLTPQGRSQARATATALQRSLRPEAVWSSPMRRAVETAEPIAGAFELPVRTDARLRERMNRESGDTRSIEEFLADWHRATADRDHRPHSGDSSRAAADRFLAALGELRDGHSHGTVIVVAHGGVTTDALRTILGDDDLADQAPGIVANGIPCCAITTLSTGRHGWRVESIAVTNHLDHTRRPGAAS